MLIPLIVISDISITSKPCALKLTNLPVIAISMGMKAFKNHYGINIYMDILTCPSNCIFNEYKKKDILHRRD